MIPRIISWLALGLAALWAVPQTRAQELVVQPTPFTVLIDFAALRQASAPKLSLPIWLESIACTPSTSSLDSVMNSGTSTIAGALPETAEISRTTVRIRLRAMPGLNDTLLLRLFFDDLSTAHPSVTAWSETGVASFSSGELGAGLQLPVSESMSIPTQGVAYLDIDVPGDGSNLRKVLLTTLKTATVAQSLDLASISATGTGGIAPVVDPFGNPEPKPAGTNDTYLFGRIRATLEAGYIQLAAPSSTGTASGTSSLQTSATYDFELENTPLLALITLDVLNADPLAPLQAWINGVPAGSVSLQLSDLADPAYTGLVRPLQEMRFHYAGWLHGQLVLPGSALKAGPNTLTLQLPAGASPVAIRAIELQLKHNWRILDYQLAP